MMVFIVFGVWIIKTWNTTHRTWNKLTSLVNQHRSLFIAIGLFLLGATISVFTAVNMRAAVGEWKAFYVEPVLLFFVLITTICHLEQSGAEPKDLDKSRRKLFERIIDIIRNDSVQLQLLIFALVLLGLATGILATIQHFTGWLVPWDFWENGGSYRVTGWYGFPNGVGLFLAPTALLILYMFFTNFLTKTKTSFSYGKLGVGLLAFIFSLLGIVFAKSTGGLIGVVAGIGLLLIFYNKIRWPVIVLGLLAIVGVFSLPSHNSIRQELLAQNRSGQLRVDMWAEATQYLSEHPIRGAGLASYKTVIYPYRMDKWIEVFHHPHNLFLTIWVNTGLIGLIGFVWVLVWFYRVGLSFIMKHKKKDISTNTNHLLVLFLLATMTSILVTGLVDSPYIKNDYSLLFWFLVAGMVLATTQEKKSTHHLSY